MTRQRKRTAQPYLNELLGLRIRRADTHAHTKKDFVYHQETNFLLEFFLSSKKKNNKKKEGEKQRSQGELVTRGGRKVSDKELAICAWQCLRYVGSYVRQIPYG